MLGALGQGRLQLEQLVDAQVGAVGQGRALPLRLGATSRSGARARPPRPPTPRSPGRCAPCGRRPAARRTRPRRPPAGRPPRRPGPARPGTLSSASPWTTRSGTPSGTRAIGEARRYTAGSRSGVVPSRSAAAPSDRLRRKASTRSATGACATTPTTDSGRAAAASSARWPPAEWPTSATRRRSTRGSATEPRVASAASTSSSSPGQLPPPPRRRYSTFSAAQPRRDHVGRERVHQLGAVAGAPVAAVHERHDGKRPVALGQRELGALVVVRCRS